MDDNQRANGRSAIISLKRKVYPKHRGSQVKFRAAGVPPLSLRWDQEKQGSRVCRALTLGANDISSPGPYLAPVRCVESTKHLQTSYSAILDRHGRHM